MCLCAYATAACARMGGSCGVALINTFVTVMGTTVSAWAAHHPVCACARASHHSARSWTVPTEMTVSWVDGPGTDKNFCHGHGHARRGVADAGRAADACSVWCPSQSSALALQSSLWGSMAWCPRTRPEMPAGHARRGVADVARAARGHGSVRRAARHGTRGWSVRAPLWQALMHVHTHIAISARAQSCDRAPIRARDSVGSSSPTSQEQQPP